RYYGEDVPDDSEAKEFRELITEVVENGGVLLLVGTDTSAVTVKWAMSNFLNNLEVLNKAKEEIDAQVGEERFIDESNIAKLPYL
ncbi:hypothetical protein Gohar_013429, partial [Gossypium harknessii]|nr:hypothetical protein [Gossypium harknessii]